MLNGHILDFGVDYDVDADGLHLLDTDIPPTIELFEGKLFYTLPLGQASPGVTSLKSGTPNVVIANCSPGGPPDIGDLKVSVFPEIDIITETQVGSKVVKTITTDLLTGKILLKRGSVVERIKAGRNISLDTEQGTVTLNSTAADVIKAPIPTILLQNAKQSLFNLTPYIEFPENAKSAFVGKIRLPDTLNSSENLKLIFEMIGETSVLTSAVNIQFTLRYNVLNPTTGENLNKTATIQNRTISMPFPYTAFDIFSATVFEIAPSQLVPNGTLSFSVTRKNTDDSYTGNIGVIQPLYRVVTI